MFHSPSTDALGLILILGSCPRKKKSQRVARYAEYKPHRRKLAMASEGKVIRKIREAKERNLKALKI